MSILLLPQRQRVQQPPSHPETRRRHQRRRRQPLEPVLAARVRRHLEGKAPAFARDPGPAAAISRESNRGGREEEEELEPRVRD